MRSSIVKQKLARKEPVIGIALHFTDPSVYEMASLIGFDYIWMDLEHHAYTVETANNLMRAARVGNADLMARPAKGEFMRIGRLLEAGRTAFFIPAATTPTKPGRSSAGANSALWARAVSTAPIPTCPIVRWTWPNTSARPTPRPGSSSRSKTPRRWSMLTRSPPSKESTCSCSARPISRSWAAFPGQFQHPKIDEALKVIAQAAERHGKAWGTVAGTPQRVQELLNRGALWTTMRLRLDLGQERAGTGQAGYRGDEVAWEVRDCLRAWTHGDAAAVGLQGSAFRLFDCMTNSPQLAVHEIKGRSPGPHLLITGGVHGDEFEPMAAVRRLMSAIDADQVHGEVTLIPVVNEPAFGRGQRTAEDGLDLAPSVRGGPTAASPNRSPTNSRGISAPPIFISTCIPGERGCASFPFADIRCTKMPACWPGSDAWPAPSDCRSSGEPIRTSTAVRSLSPATQTCRPFTPSIWAGVGSIRRGSRLMCGVVSM